MIFDNVSCALQKQPNIKFWCFLRIDLPREVVENVYKRWIWLECNSIHYEVEAYTERMLDIYTDIIYQPAKCKLCGDKTCYYVRPGNKYHAFSIDYYMEIVKPIKKNYQMQLAKHRKMVQHYLDSSAFEVQIVTFIEKSTAWPYHRLPGLEIL